MGVLERIGSRLSDEEWRYVAAGGLAFLGLVTWALGFRTMRRSPGLGDPSCPVETYIEVLVGHGAAERVARGAWTYEPIIVAAADHFGAPADLMMALAHTESTFQPTAKSSAGAVGLMQIMPTTAKSLQKALVDAGDWPFLELDREDPEQSAWMAAYHIADMLKRRDVTNALAAYNAGGAKVRPGTSQDEWPAAARNYAKAVLARTKYYQEIWNRCGILSF